MTPFQTILRGVPTIESPLFETSLEQMGLSNFERQIALDLHENGFAVFDFPDDDIMNRIERIKGHLGPHYNFDHWKSVGHGKGEGLRIQDAWIIDEDVGQIAKNENVVGLLGKLYGRAAFPFQTLNFPVGTQQHFHSDSAHFSSIPERFMCGVWLAMEDIGPDQGPLVYYPGSHKWPIVTNEMIARRVGSNPGTGAQTPYEGAWQAMIDATGVKPKYFEAKKGQALVWAANLLHGGSRQADTSKTRWSQVTHYYFEDCTYYCPAFSDTSAGGLSLKRIRNIASGEIVDHKYVDVSLPEARDGFRSHEFKEYKDIDGLPDDFDEIGYLRMNEDVIASGASAIDHYLNHGASEGRRYR